MIYCRCCDNYFPTTSFHMDDTQFRYNIIWMTSSFVTLSCGWNNISISVHAHGSQIKLSMWDSIDLKLCDRSWNQSLLQPEACLNVHFQYWAKGSIGVSIHSRRPQSLATVFIIIFVYPSPHPFLVFIQGRGLGDGNTKIITQTVASDCVAGTVRNAPDD